MYKKTQHVLYVYVTHDFTSLLPHTEVAVYIDHEVCIIRNDMYEPVTILSRSFPASAIFLGRLAAWSLMFPYRYICTCTAKQSLLFRWCKRIGWTSISRNPKNRCALASPDCQAKHESLNKTNSSIPNSAFPDVIDHDGGVQRPDQAHTCALGEYWSLLPHCFAFVWIEVSFLHVL